MLGKIVHYTNNDGQTFAAIVVRSLGSYSTLQVFTCEGISIVPDVLMSTIDGPQRGHWHWPSHTPDPTKESPI